MNDLISREAAIKVIENLCTDGKMYGNEGMTLIDAYEAINGISDLPAAYDVDKVVEQLEAREYNFGNAIGVLKGADIRTEVYSHAIEIVKGGLEK